MSRHHEEGFTAIETLVTLVIAVMFIISLNSLFVAIIRSTASSRNRSDASTLAYSYLRTYAYPGASSNWFVCDSTSDMTQNASAPGQTIPGASGMLSDTQTTLPQPVQYKVTALAPYGCTATASTSPLMIHSVVTYGPNNFSVDHTTYIERIQ